MSDNRFNIDFFEFSFLVEACIPPKPIARSVFWDKVINEYYHVLSIAERKSLYKWMSRHWLMEQGIDENNKECIIFNARYDPDNQYLVTTNYNGKTEEKECFRYNGMYYINKDTNIVEQYITNIKKI